MTTASRVLARYRRADPGGRPAGAAQRPRTAARARPLPLWLRRAGDEPAPCRCSISTKWPAWSGSATTTSLPAASTTPSPTCCPSRRPSGGFGLWGPFSYTELWLDAYVTDFLLARQGRRLRRAGAGALQRPRQSRQPGVLRRRFRQGRRGHRLCALRPGPCRAGGHRRPSLLRSRRKLDNFGSPLAKAQIGAALALYGERTRAETGFAAAVADLAQAGDDPAIAATTAAACATSPASSRWSANSSRPGSSDGAGQAAGRPARPRPLDLDPGGRLDAGGGVDTRPRHGERRADARRQDGDEPALPPLHRARTAPRPRWSSPTRTTPRPRRLSP